MKHTSITRRLVVTNEAARHPFRRTLPPPAMTAPARRSGDDDLKLFALSFMAFFVCFYTLIA